MTQGTEVTILLVEDDLAHAEIVRRNLDEFGVANRLVHVRDGQAALDYLRREGDYADPAAAPRPQLLLIDLRMPRVDGLEVLRQVKQDPSLQDIPAVILTTSAAEGDRLKAYEFGACSYLVKPLQFEAFTRQMKDFGFYWLMWNQFPGRG